MESGSNKIDISKYLLATLSIFVNVLSGCGGGTVGTGDSSTQFSGNIKSLNGSPLSGVDVTVLETGNRTKTDTAGFFVVESKVSADEARLLVDTGSTTGIIAVSDQSLDNSSVMMEIQVDSAQNLVSLQSINVEKKLGSGEGTSTPPSSFNGIPEYNINGKIIDEHGAPLKGIPVYLTFLGSKTKTDGKGVFTFHENSHRMRTLGLAVVIQNVGGGLGGTRLPTDVPRVNVDIVLKVVVINPGVPAPVTGAPGPVGPQYYLQIVSQKITT